MTDINEIFSKGGAMERCCKRAIRNCALSGHTGHYRPDALIEAIHRYSFDTILMAVNAADPHHYSFSEQLLPLAVEKQMAYRNESPGAWPHPCIVDTTAN